MTPRALPLLVLLALGLPLAAVAQAPSYHRLVLEAEEFRPRSGWKPLRNGQGNYMVDAIGASHFSNEQVLHAESNAAGAVAELETTIPAAGRYSVWAQYEAPLGHNVCFEVAIEQAEGQVFRQTYGAGTDEGARAAAAAAKLPNPEKAKVPSRFWFFTAGFKPWVDWEWGSEGAIGERYSAELKAGKARVILRSAPNAQPAADRNIDFLFLTSEPDDAFTKRGTPFYPIFDEIALPGRVYARVTNRLPGARSYFRSRYRVNRIPWEYPAAILGKDGIAAAAPAADARGWLASGESTPWVDLSSRDTTHLSHLLLEQVSAGREKPEIRCTVELAADPEGKRLLRRLDYHEPKGGQLTLSLPPYPARNPEEILTAEEQTAKLLTALRTSPAAGPIPRRTPLYGVIHGADFTSPTALNRAYLDLYRELGLNTVPMLPPEKAAQWADALKSAGVQPVRSYLYGGDAWYPSDANIAKAKAEIEAAGLQPLLRGFFYGDGWSLEQWAPLPKENAARDPQFRAWAQQKGWKPEELLPGAETGTDPWRAITVQEDPRDAARHPRLYVESLRFLEETALTPLAAQAAKLRRAFGPDVLMGAGFSTHPLFWPRVGPYVQLFETGAANRAQHDDFFWQAGEVSPQVDGFLLDAFRAGLDGAPNPDGLLSQSVMPHSPGNTDRSFRLTNYLALAHGARQLDYSGVGPQHGATENYIDYRDTSRYALIRDITREIGAVDDWIADGRVRPAKVAILLSESTDRWEPTVLQDPQPPYADSPRASIAYNQERKYLWLLLRHAQLNVRFVTEAQVERGQLKEVSTLYLVGDHLTRPASEAIRDWVQDGGRLVSVAGGGFKDEYGNINNTLREVYGAARQALQKRDVFFRSKIELPRLRSLERMQVTLPGSNNFAMDALGMFQRLDATPGARIVARYSDGNPAAIERTYGKGIATLIGALPATAYVKSALPALPPDRGPFAHYLPTRFDLSIRNWIAGYALARVSPDAACSDPLVTTNVLESKHGLLLPLANFRGSRIGSLKVAVSHAGDVTRVVSRKHGELRFRRVDPPASASVTFPTGAAWKDAGNLVVFDLPLDQTDFVQIYR